ncbi:iron export ABC transporter permease subunit FetB [Desulfobotulus sp. H1]|uniref:Iron export ABC transporter permease subunit FetB n=1 Tax=Desulfobotulus pelophilus TaxID=2823377 RepID=A0ABT3NBC5_9BACT|nr:iron export ABC transporter permease subunit FetB [Desulfobotulus pelophilus]MCW7754725.1 iron export ABC transporter permease subunit FetB [Desulfobotulus pelophilus]
MILLTPFDLALASLLILINAGLSLFLRLGIGRQLMISAARATAQLSLLGFALKFIFELIHPGLLGLMVLFMLATAGWEVMRRQSLRFAGPWGFGIGTGAMCLSSFLITLFALMVIISQDPWYTPQYAIPLLGMILGNTMNGIAIGLDRLTQTLWEKKAIIETRLMLGQRFSEAVSDIRKDSIRSGMIPIINAMSVAGIVSLPGMMTGQILAGAPPMEAVKYQILIMFLIAGSTGFGTIFAVTAGARRLSDHRERLRLDRLKKY